LALIRTVPRHGLLRLEGIAQNDPTDAHDLTEGGFEAGFFIFLVLFRSFPRRQQIRHLLFTEKSNPLQPGPLLLGTVDGLNVEHNLHETRPSCKAMTSLRSAGGKSNVANSLAVTHFRSSQPSTCAVPGLIVHRKKCSSTDFSGYSWRTV